MIEIVSIGGVALILLIAALWTADRIKQSKRDEAGLLRELTELNTHALVLLENSPQAIVKFETKGLIRAVNPVAEELFGYSAYELLGQNIIKLVPEALFTQRMGETLEIRCKDGERLRLSFRAARSDLPRLSFIYLFFDPPAKEPDAVEVRAASGGSNGSRKAISEIHSVPGRSLSYAAGIVGRIASQYETLLTTINGYSELALMDTPEVSPLHQGLQEVVTASDRASSLTRHLVAFSGNQLMPVEPVDLNELIKGVRLQLRETIQRPIDFDLAPMDRALLANPDCLRQVILLLCGSARDRMLKTDRLQLRTRLREVTGPRQVMSGELKPGIYGVLAIADSGRPLNQHTLDHLFEPLYLIHEDVGIDLGAVYGMVQSLGGGIDVMTGEGIGTTFEILLPSAKAAQAANASSTAI